MKDPALTRQSLAESRFLDDEARSQALLIPVLHGGIT